MKPVLTLLILSLLLGRALSAPSTQATPRPSPGSAPRAQLVQASKKKQPGGTVYFNLRKYIDAVVAQDPGLISSRLALMSNAEEIKATRASYLPHLSAIADIGLVAGPQYLSFVAPTIRLENVRTVGAGVYEVGGASLTMPFFKDGTFLGINTPPAVNIKRAQGQILAAQTRLEQAEVIYQATYVFLRAISSAKQVEILRAELDLVQKQTAIIEEKAKYNLVTAEDLAAAENKLKDAELRVNTGATAAIDAFFRLAELVGIEDPRQVRIEVKYPTPAPLASFDGALLRMNVDHPAITAQQGAVNEAKANLALRQIQLWPSGSVRSTYRYGEDLSEIGQEQFVGVLSISAPVFDFGELHYAAKAADYNLQSQNEKLVKVHNDLRQSIFDDFKNIQNETLLLANNNTVVTDDQRTVDRLQELAKYGQVPIPALLDAQLQLLAAKEAQDGLTVTLYTDYAFLDRTTAGEWHWFR